MAVNKGGGSDPYRRFRCQRVKLDIFPAVESDATKFFAR